MKRIILLFFCIFFSVHAVYPPLNSKLKPHAHLAYYFRESPFDGLPLIPKISCDGSSVYSVSSAGTKPSMWFVTKWNFAGNKIKKICIHPVSDPQAMDLSSDEKTILVISKDEKSGLSYYELYAVGAEKIERRFRKKVAEGFEGTVSSCAIKGDGSCFAISVISGNASLVFLYSGKTGEMISTILNGYGSKPTFVRWFGDQLMTYSTILNPEIIFWDVSRKSPAFEIKLPFSALSAINYDETQKNIAVVCCDEDGKYIVQVFNFDKKVIFQKQIPSFCFWVGLGKDGKTVAGVTGSKDVYLWNIQTNTTILHHKLSDSREWNSTFYDVKWINDAVIKWVFYNGVTGSIGT